ncbi:hypothetical protein [Pontibacter cellulosilyticus]|uniref:Uncharacterized protein n=1 Tax=Pontibacter cellulosilyticus TaxID=1720253 RepID=A0A923NA08_9BACT|nr:hypothetical protein [Pontibacter cellulosilyticus]MBC5995016.1 hypothetical protein [Pontibacter cellulosilyticus]
MEIIGVDKDGFFATYTVNNQITLEHYNPDHERFWTTALSPKTNDGKSAKFHCVEMLKGDLYMLSYNTTGNSTRVYSQKISHNGNYAPDIELIAQSNKGDNVLMAKAPDDAAFAVAVNGEDSHTISLFSHELVPRWTSTIKYKGNAEELLVQPDGTTYLLTKAPAAAPATTAYYLYQFNSETGKSSELVLGHTEYRPIRAKMAAVSGNIVAVTGYVSPSNSVASHNPEPIGTFLYRIDKRHFQDRFASYAPFSKKFISEYKRLKPDNDNSQRLRNLHLDKAIPTPDGGLYLLGEVCETENRAGTFVYHNNDILVIKLRKNGSTAFTTSINKLQSGTNMQNTIRSYFAAVVQDTLRILYLDFEFKNQADDKIAMYSPRSSLKTPVMVSVHPDGAKTVKPLHTTKTGSAHGFYLRPCSAYTVNNNEYIVIGMGPDFYRYGRMKF